MKERPLVPFPPSIRRRDIACSRTVGLSLLILTLVGSTYEALTQTETRLWRYRTLGPSTVTDDCPICDRVSVPHPASGGFDLVKVTESHAKAEYRLESIHLATSLASWEPVEFHGRGEAVVTASGQVESMVLRLNSNLSTNDYVFVVDTNRPAVSRLWPVFEVNLVETQAATWVQAFFADLLVAPAREIWFSTDHGMTPGVPDLTPIKGDDFLSASGRILRLGRAMLAGAGFETPELDGLLDAVQPGPGGEMVFSLRQDAESSDLGLVQHGDVVTERGRYLAANQLLTSAFGIMPLVPDVGLDAVRVQPGADTLFSITAGIFSEGAGWLGPGDLLSSEGRVVRTAAQLTAAYKPSPEGDFGLDAFYVWPSGEVWFSTETGFTSATLGPVGSGDLLSDQGYIVCKNLDLVRPFQPLEDLVDFGLDGLWVVSDAVAAATVPWMGPVEVRSDPPLFRVSWTGEGSAFQVERADSVTGPFVLWGEPEPRATVDMELPAPDGTEFYRVRQW